MEYYSKQKSLSFAGIYLKNGKTLYRSSFINEDAVSKETGINGLRNRFVLNRYLGLYSKAVIYDNKSKRKLEEYNELGIKTNSYEENSHSVNN